MRKSAQIKTFLALLMLFVTAAHAVRAEAYEESGKKHSWFSFNKPAKKNPADQMSHAQALLKENELKAAGKAFRALVTTWPGSPEAPMAQWAYARLLDKQGKSLDAFDEYQKLMEDYSGRFPDYNQALERQFAIATNVMTRRKAKFLFLPGFEAPERAIPLLEKVVANGPRSSYAPEAQYLIGVAHEKNFEYELAVVAYIATLHRYPLSAYAEPAAFGRARSLYKLSKDYPNDYETLNEAWAGIMVFLRTYPQSSFAAEATAIRDDLLKKKAQVAYEIADFYDHKAKRPTAARESYERFVDEYPKSEWTDEAKNRMMSLSGKTDKPTKEDDADVQN